MPTEAERVKVNASGALGSVVAGPVADGLYSPDARGNAERAWEELPKQPHGNSQRILYLDDEEPLVFLAGTFLARLGYEVKGCTRPEEALEAFNANPAAFDLLVTDLNMPGISGLDVARECLTLRN